VEKPEKAETLVSFFTKKGYFLAFFLTQQIPLSGSSD
jgi:hypothetical protein